MNNIRFPNPPSIDDLSNERSRLDLFRRDQHNLSTIFKAKLLMRHMYAVHIFLPGSRYGQRVKVWAKRKK